MLNECYHISEEDFLAAIHTSISSIEKSSLLLAKESIDAIISKLNEKDDYNSDSFDLRIKIFKRINFSIPLLLKIKAILGEANNTYILLSTALINKTLKGVQVYIKDKIYLTGEDSSILKLFSFDMTEDFEQYFKKILPSILHEIRKNALHSYYPRNVYNSDYKNGKIPDLGFIILEKELINMDKNSKILPKKNTYFYEEDIRYIHLKMKIKALKEKNIEFKINYVSFCFTSITEKVEYSFTEIVKINNNTKEIIFKGYGNGEKNIYKSFIDKIDVYVNNFLIFSQLIEKNRPPIERLMEAEKKFKEDCIKIENSNYFKEEIEQEFQKLAEIEKWKLFRLRKTKENEIREQKRIIQDLHDKRKKQKENEISKINEEYVKNRKEIEKDIEIERTYIEKNTLKGIENVGIKNEEKKSKIITEPISPKENKKLAEDRTVCIVVDCQKQRYFTLTQLKIDITPKFLTEEGTFKDNRLMQEARPSDYYVLKTQNYPHLSEGSVIKLNLDNYESINVKSNKHNTYNIYYDKTDFSEMDLILLRKINFIED